MVWFVLERIVVSATLVSDDDERCEEEDHG
jgi:hypothetical protein